MPSKNQHALRLRLGYLMPLLPLPQKTKRFLLVLLIFSCGYVCNDIANVLGINFTQKAYAEEQLSKRSIQKIIESCEIPYRGYVDGGYVGGLYIDC